MTNTYTLTTKDAARWRSVLPASRSIHGSVEYVRMHEAHTGWEGRLFVVEDGTPIVGYPHYIRPVPRVSNSDGSPTWHDTTTPEYTGPMWLTSASESQARTIDFPTLFADHCDSEGIIAEFAHLNPWASDDLLDEPSVVPDREIVYLDLSGDEEEVWMKSLSSDARRQTKQGWKAGVSVRRSLAERDIAEFHRLYTNTMAARNAHARYLFPLEHFMAFAEELPENAFFVVAEHAGTAVAAGLFLHDETNLYWHLSAADREHIRARPVNVYLFDTMRRALAGDWQRMILGGAVTEGDGVFRFKANFSRLRAQFSTYRRIHDQAAYDAAVQAWRRDNVGTDSPSEYFPAYRAEPAQQG